MVRSAAGQLLTVGIAIYYCVVLFALATLVYLQVQFFLGSSRKSVTYPNTGSSAALLATAFPLNVKPECNCSTDGKASVNCPTDFQPKSRAPDEILDVAEQIYQENVKRRKQVYGENPVEILQKWHSTKPLLNTPLEMPTAYELEMFAPNYPCFPEERLGKWTDGGKFICRPDTLNSSSIVYSIGCNGIDSFELELYKRTRSKIHVFDHTLKPKVKEAVSRKTAYKFHDVGIAASTNKASKLMSLQDMMAWLGHTYIDIFKIDCEGCEYSVLPAILESVKKAPFGQVQVELHRITHPAALQNFFQLMERHGFRLFHVEVNWRYIVNIELAYIHEDLC